MATTIQVSAELVGELKERKLSERESYEEVIRDLLEDSLAITEQTKRELAEAREEIKAGKIHSLETVKQSWGTSLLARAFTPVVSCNYFPSIV